MVVAPEGFKDAECFIPKAALEKAGATVQVASLRTGKATSDQGQGGKPHSSVEIALRDSEKEVRSFHRRTSDARGRWGGYRGAASGRSGSAAGAGRQAASNARLSAAQELPGGRRELRD